MGEAECLRVAQARLEEGDPLGALEVLRRLGPGPRSRATAQRLLGRAYYHCAQLDRALEALRLAVGLDPADTQARFVLGQTLHRLGRPREALKHLRIAAAISGRPDYQQRVDALVAARGSAAA
ncbi:CDC27 family protein [Pseudonocardia hispaniensis]|uniref:CDC27 family protein n=1 Tax=Pseudonocardia hispaniensis TaxID=904933 RepID=A0ABW1J5D7_9PSEU